MEHNNTQIEIVDKPPVNREIKIIDSDQQPESEYAAGLKHYSSAWVLTWTGILASFLAILYFAYLGYRFDAWQLHIVTLSLVGLMLTAVISTVLIRRNKPKGIWFFLVGVQLCFFLYGLLIDRQGLISLGCILAISSLVAIQSLPISGFRRALNLAMIFGILAALTDFIHLSFQYVMPDSVNYFVATILIVTMIVFCVNLIKNFRSYHTRVQLVFTVTAAGIVALGIFSVVMTAFIERRITQNYNYVLVSTAEHTAKTLDNFFSDNLITIRAESQLPVFSEYLQTPDQKRVNSQLQEDLHITLQGLVQKNPKHVSSYSVLDLRGVNVADTVLKDIGEDRSGLDAFKRVLENGQAYVSPIEFTKNTTIATFNFSAPITDDVGGILGVLMVTYKADLIQDFLDSYKGSGNENIYVFIVDENHLRLAHTLNPNLRFKKVTPLDQNLWIRLTDERRLPNLPIEELSTNIPSLEKALQVASEYPFYATQFNQPDQGGGQASTMQAGFYSMKTQPWQVVYAVDHAAILHPIQDLMPLAIMLTFILIGLFVAAGLYTADVINKPIKELTETTKLVIAGNWDEEAPVQSGADAGSLAQSFNTLLAQIKLKLEGMENTVSKRDQLSEHHSNQLRALSEVSQTIVTTRIIDELLPKIVQLISQHFGYSHIGIYLIDATGEYAILQAMISKEGESISAYAQKIQVAEGGIIGYVINNKEHRIVEDMLEDDLYTNNPDFPDTRSEIAIPLLGGDQVIGVLDIQSREPNAFAQDDITTLLLIADQVAIAIDNARLFRENQGALEAIRRAYSQLSQDAWAKLLHEQPELGYLANRLDISYTPANGWHPEEVQAAQTGSTIQVSNDTLAIPIKERDHVLGILRLRKPDSHMWSKDELALAETLAQQLYLALENARLYQETQRRAERERLASEITAKLRASNDPQVIMQTAIQELRRVLNIRSEEVPPNAALRSTDHMPRQQDASSQESQEIG